VGCATVLKLADMLLTIWLSGLPRNNCCISS
jgi:hypothetical protein